MRSFPAYLEAHLETIGRLNADGVGRRGRAGRCSGCRGVVVRALDADVAGLTATADLLCLTPAGEVVALCSGRETYSAHYADNVWHLDYRLSWRIEGHPASISWPVFAEHICGSKTLPHFTNELAPAFSSEECAF